MLLLALLGYAYVFGILAFTLGLLVLLVVLLIRFHRGGAVFLKLAIPLVGLIFIILRSLWVRLAPPGGRPLSRQEAPPLFVAIEELRSSLRAPAVHHILLTDEFNAAVAQVPRFGVFGFSRNYLIVGLPLLQALSADQFRAVLAHELGHLSKSHGRFGVWIYRMRGVWAQLLSRLVADEHWGRALFLPFFRWYAPFFGAYSFSLARAQEFEADCDSASAAGARHAADALLALELQGQFLDRHYWPTLFRSVNQQAQPPTPFHSLVGALRASAATADADACLAEALARQTDDADTHPVLRERLAALGQEPRVPAVPTSTAAEWAFGRLCDQIVAEMDGQWQDEVGAAWQARHHEAHQALAELRAFEHGDEHGPLAADEALRRARLTEEFGDERLALARYREALDRDPDSADAQFAVGRLLVQAGDDEGIALIDRAMGQDWEYVLPGCQLLIGHLCERGRSSEAEAYRQRATEQHKALMAASHERRNVRQGDSFIAHGLSEAAAASIAAQVATFPHVATAYLVRKSLQHFPEKPVYVLGIVIKQPWYRHRSAKTDLKLAHAVAQAIDHPDPFYVVPLNFANNALRKPILAVADALIYQRS